MEARTGNEEIRGEERKRLILITNENERYDRSTYLALFAFQ